MPEPELGELLAKHDMRQVAQRITSRYHLTTLSAEETDDYIHHRLKTAGCSHRIFSKAACSTAYKLTEGTPRLLNLLCDRALIAAYSKGENEVSTSLIKQAAKEALPYVKVQSVGSGLSWLSILLLIIALISIGFFLQPQWREQIVDYWQPSSINQPVGKATPTPAVAQTVTTVTDDAITEDAGLKAAEIAPQQAPINTPTESKADAATNEHPDGLSPAKLEKMRKQADVDFRLGIPTAID